MRRLSSVLLWSLTACGAGDASVSIIFPNDVSRQAVRRLRIESYDPDAGGAPASLRDCSDFLGKARVGDDPLGAPVRADYQCVDTAQNACNGGWFDGRDDLIITRGRRIIYALAFSSTLDTATPILEGCTDQFDSDGGSGESQEVPIEMRLVIPDNARMVKSGGDRQIGRAGEELLVPLEVRVQADSPDGTGGTYDIPGVPIVFSTETTGYDLLDGDSAAAYSTTTNLEGRASVRVRLPTSAGTGEILATAAALETETAPGRHEALFTVSVTPVPTFPSKDVLGVGDGTIPIAASVGDIDADNTADLAIVTCEGNRENCTPGIDGVLPAGRTRLSVYTSAGLSSRQQLTTPVSAGILPADIVIEDIAPAPGRREVVLLNSRRADCEQRGCEGAEILVFSANGPNLTLDSRHTMTGSNAVALTTFESTDNGPYRGIAMVAQGRSVNDRVCSPTPRCLPWQGGECDTNPEVCGCPPQERCECIGCSGPNQAGVCMARDKLVDVLVTRSVQQVDRLYNKNGCQVPVLDCTNRAGEESYCECQDPGNELLRCTLMDACGCRVPPRVYVGALDAPVLPYEIVAGGLRDPANWDIVVPSVGGLELIEETSGTFAWSAEPIINAPIHDAVIVPLDDELERRATGDPPPDVVWVSREPCLDGDNFQASCGVWRPLDEGVEARGCLGAYFTDGEESVFKLRTPTAGGCRRHILDYEPHGMCSGDFNGDDHADIAVASRDSGLLYIYSGDGYGGLLDPPETVELPGDSGGPVACGDLDADDLDDVVVLNGNTGAVYLIRTRG